MKEVRCSVCGIRTDHFIRHKLKPYCIKCFFERFNYCSKCGKIFEYKHLLTSVKSKYLEYYCWKCYNELPTCDLCGCRIGAEGQVYLAKIEGFYLLICEDCHLSNEFKKGGL